MKEPDYSSKAHKIEMFIALLDGKELQSRWRDTNGDWMDWSESDGSGIHDSAGQHRIKPTQETMDYAAWQQWEYDQIGIGIGQIIESNFQIWQAALAWERSKNG